MYKPWLSVGSGGCSQVTFTSQENSTSSILPKHIWGGGASWAKTGKKESTCPSSSRRTRPADWNEGRTGPEDREISSPKQLNLPFFVTYKVLLEPKHAHLFMNSLWLLSHYIRIVTVEYVLQSLKYCSALGKHTHKLLIPDTDHDLPVFEIL